MPNVHLSFYGRPYYSPHPLIHGAAPGIHPRVRSAGHAEDLGSDGAAVLLPHVEFPAGPAQGLLASVTVDDGRTFSADLTGLCSVGNAHGVFW